MLEWEKDFTEEELKELDEMDREIDLQDNWEEAVTDALKRDGAEREVKFRELRSSVLNEALKRHGFHGQKLNLDKLAKYYMASFLAVTLFGDNKYSKLITPHPSPEIKPTLASVVISQDEWHGATFSTMTKNEHVLFSELLKNIDGITFEGSENNEEPQLTIRFFVNDIFK